MEYESRGFWKPARHLELLCAKLEAVERGEITRLMVFMPPRHGKSLVVSQKFPTLYLGRNPDKEVIISSYSADLAYDFSRIARNTLRDWGPVLWGISLSDESAAVGRWGIAGYRGGLVAAGVGGPVTGRGAHLAVIDDPFKNWQEAASQTIRESVWQWYRSTLRTRLAPGGVIVLVMTRWHEDDLAGRLLREAADGGEQWEVISLPAEAEENDILCRQPGELLWLERYSAKEYEDTKKAIGSYLWTALYQQRPSPAGGGKFQRSYFRYFYQEGSYNVLRRPEDEVGQPPVRYMASSCLVFQTIDTAATEKQSSDYFVCETWAITPGADLLLLDVFREKAETTKHQAILASQYQRWQPVFQAVENKTFGLNVIQEAVLTGAPVRALKADKDKVSRSLPMVARYEVGKVYHRQNAPWLGDFEDELLAFPKGEKDDQVDCASYAGLTLVELSMEPQPEDQIYDNPDYDYHIE